MYDFMELEHYGATIAPLEWYDGWRSASLVWPDARPLCVKGINAFENQTQNTTALVN